MEKITILLVDDHKLIRESWILLLKGEPHFEVIGSTDNAETAISIARDKRPRVVLMDINMTPVNGFEATKMIRKYSPASRVIGLSMHCMPAYVRKMLQLGATGYVTKNSSKEELIEAINTVNSGGRYICAEVKEILARQEFEFEHQKPAIHMLSSREVDVVKLIRDGLSSKQIASELCVSLKTIEVHRYNILKKLDLKNTASLVNMVNQQGL